MKKIRNSNIEFIRILLMFFIILHHTSIYGLENNSTLNTSQQIIVAILSSFGKISVILFILITGYFQGNKERTNKHSLQNIHRVTLFYSISIFVIFCILFPIYKINFGRIINAVFPICSGAYWFITDYVILLIISPYINKLCMSLSKKEFQKLLFISFVLLCFVNYLPFFDLDMSSIIYFVFFYISGIYIQNYFESSKMKNYNFKIIFLCLSVFYFLCIYLGKTLDITVLSDVVQLSSPIGYAIAVSIFLAILKFKPTHFKVINHISKYILPIYLIHDNRLIRAWIYDDLFHLTRIHFSNNLQLIFITIMDALLIFIICFFIEIIRVILMNKIKKICTKS